MKQKQVMLSFCVLLSLMFSCMQVEGMAGMLAKGALGASTQPPGAVPGAAPPGMAPPIPGMKAPRGKTVTPPAPKLSPEQQRKFDASVMDAICLQMIAVMPIGNMGIYYNKPMALSKITAELKKTEKSAQSLKGIDQMEAYAKCIIKSLESTSLVKDPAAATSKTPSAAPPKPDLTEPLKTQTASILGAMCQKGIDALGASPEGMPPSTGKKGGGGKKKGGAPASPDSLTPDGKDKKTAATKYQTVANSAETSSLDKILYFARCISTTLGNGRSAIRIPLPTDQYKRTLLSLSTALIHLMPKDQKMPVVAIKLEALRSKDDRIKLEKYAETIIKALAVPEGEAVPDEGKQGKKGKKNKTPAAGKPGKPKKGKKGMDDTPAVNDDKKDPDIQALEDMCTGGLSIKNLKPEVKTKATEFQTSGQTESQASLTPDAAQKAKILTSYAKCISLTLGTGDAAAPPAPAETDEKEEDGEEEGSKKKSKKKSKEKPKKAAKEDTEESEEKETTDEAAQVEEEEEEAPAKGGKKGKKGKKGKRK